MPGITGEPAAVEAAADELAWAAQHLAEARDGVAARARAIGDVWQGPASLAAIAAVEGAATGTVVIADVSAGIVGPLRVFAGELRRAQQDWAEGERIALQGQAAVDGAGSGAPTDAVRDHGRLAVTDGVAVMDSAAERARIAKETAARALDEAARALARLTPAAPPVQDDGNLWDGLRKAGGDMVDEVTGIVGGVVAHLNVFGDRFGETWSTTYHTAAAAINDPLAAGFAMVQGTVEPLADSYRSGGLDEAVGRSPSVIAAALGGKGIPQLRRFVDMPPPDPNPGPHTPIAPGGGLQGHEDAGGHTLAPTRAHVGATDRQLLDRQRTSPVPLSATSSYYDRAVAERSVFENITANRAEIDTWLAADGPRTRPFEHRHDFLTGRSLPGGATDTSQASDVVGSRVVLRRDPTMPDGYRVQTSFPNP